MIILICGSRGWKNPDPIETVIVGRLMIAERRGEKLTVIHGDNGRADKFADTFGRRWGAKVIPERADWRRYQGGAGPIRNGVMLAKYHPEEVWAFRSTGKSNGTDDMIDQATKAGVPVFLVTDPAEAQPTLF